MMNKIKLYIYRSIIIPVSILDYSMTSFVTSFMTLRPTLQYVIMYEPLKYFLEFFFLLQ